MRIWIACLLNHQLFEIHKLSQHQTPSTLLPEDKEICRRPETLEGLRQMFCSSCPCKLPIQNMLKIRVFNHSTSTWLVSNKLPTPASLYHPPFMKQVLQPMASQVSHWLFVQRLSERPCLKVLLCHTEVCREISHHWKTSADISLRATGTEWSQNHLLQQSLTRIKATRCCQWKHRQIINSLKQLMYAGRE